MPSRIRGLVVDAEHDRAGELGAIDAGRRRAAARCSGTAAASGTSTEKCEPRPTVELSSSLWSSTRAMRSTIESPRPKPARDLGALDRGGGIPGRSRASSIAECRARCRRRRCAACRAARRQPTSTRPFGVYLIALETRFCSSRRSSRRSERTAERGRHEHELQALLARQRREFDFELAQQLVDAEGDDLRLHGAGVEPRNVEQRAEDLLHRLERGVDIGDEPRIFAAALALDQRGDIEARGIERLQDVVAGGGEEPRLGDVGLFGVGLGARRARRSAG